MKLLLRSILFFAVASFSPFAAAQNDFWTNDGGTPAFENAANWSGGVPSTTSIAVFDIGATVTVNSDPSILGLTVDATNQGFTVVDNNGIFTVVQTTTSSNAVNMTVASGDSLTVLGTIPAATTTNILVSNGAIFNLAGNLNFNDGIFVVGGDSTGGALNLTSGTLNYDVQTTSDDTQLDVGHGPGALGTLVQSGSSVVITGSNLSVGGLGGTGSYTLENNSTLDIGTPGAPKLNNYFFGIGYNQYGAGGANVQGSKGVLTISGSSTFNLGTGADLEVGTAVGTLGNPAPAPAGFTGGNGTINQNGAGSVVNFEAGSTAVFGGYNDGEGTYALSAGTLNIDNDTTFGSATDSTGTLAQSGGSLVASNTSDVTFGSSGTGKYELTGGTATFESGFNVGALGTVTQSTGSTLIPLATVTFASGSTYNMNGGNANFSGTSSNVPYSSTLALNGTLNLNGGTLQVGEDMLLNSNLTGALNYGGGTLKLTSGATTTFNDTFSGAVLAAGTVSTIDASTSGLSTFNFTDPLLTDGGSVGGGIILIGDGTTNFNYSTFEANTYTGPTTIEEGTLNTSGADIANSSSLTMGTGGTINLTLAAGGLAYNGSIAGPGTLDVNYLNPNDVLTIHSNSDFTGNIVLGSNGTVGTLQVYDGTFGNISDNGTGSGLTVGDNTGAYTGTVNLLSDSYTGATTVYNKFTLNAPNLDGDLSNAGVVNVSGASGVAGNVTANSGTLTAQNVGGNIVGSTGTLASNATLGSVKNVPTFTIGGTLASSGTMMVRLNGLNADYYNVTGTADVSGTYFHLVNPVGTGTYTIVNSAGLTAANVTTNPSTALFSATLTATATQLNLNTVQGYLSPFANTPNEAAVAGALDPFTQLPPPSFAPLLAILDQLPAGQIPVALDQLSPESLQYARTISIENSTFMAQQVDGEMANLRSGFEGIDASGLRVVDSGLSSNLGMSLGSMLAYNAPSFNQPAPNGVNYYPQDDTSPSSSSSTMTTTTTSSTSVSSPHSISDSPNPETTTSPTSLSRSEPDFKGPRLNEFILGNVVLADLNQDQGSPNAAPTKASYTAGNVAAGVSFRMTSNLSAGVLFDYNHTDAKTDSYGSKTKVDSYSPGLFATYSNHGFFVNGLFSFGYNTYANTRNIPIIGSSATSSPTGQQYVTNLDGGYDFQPRNHRQWIFGPNLGLTYTHLDIDSFTESGAGPADLSVNDQSIDSLRGRLGGHIMYQARSGPILFQPNFTAMWQHEFLNDSSGITSTFNIPGTGPFTIQTANSGKDSALLGVGLTATLDNSMAFYLNYLADVGASDYFAQSIEGGFKASF